VNRRTTRYVSASGPIHPRVASGGTFRVDARGTANHAALHAARSQLGPGLRRQLHPARTPAANARQRFPSLLRLAPAASGLAIAALAGVWTPFVVGCVVSAAWFALRRRPDAADDPMSAVDLGAPELDAFDRQLADAAGELTAPQRATLCEIKALIARLARERGGDDDTAAIEDQVYAAACVRRYVPELLAAFLAVPADARTALIPAANASALELLSQQLELLRCELEVRRLRSVRAATGVLVRQQRTRRVPRAVRE